MQGEGARCAFVDSRPSLVNGVSWGHCPSAAGGGTEETLGQTREGPCAMGTLAPRLGGRPGTEAMSPMFSWGHMCPSSRVPHKLGSALSSSCARPSLRPSYSYQPAQLQPLAPPTLLLKHSELARSCLCSLTFGDTRLPRGLGMQGAWCEVDSPKMGS